MSDEVDARAEVRRLMERARGVVVRIMHCDVPFDPRLPEPDPIPENPASEHIDRVNEKQRKEWRRKNKPRADVVRPQLDEFRQLCQCGLDRARQRYLDSVQTFRRECQVAGLAAAKTVPGVPGWLCGYACVNCGRNMLDDLERLEAEMAGLEELEGIRRDDERSLDLRQAVASAIVEAPDSGWTLVQVAERAGYSPDHVRKRSTTLQKAGILRKLPNERFVAGSKAREALP